MALQPVNLSGSQAAHSTQATPQAQSTEPTRQAPSASQTQAFNALSGGADASVGMRVPEDNVTDRRYIYPEGKGPIIQDGMPEGPDKITCPVEPEQPIINITGPILAKEWPSY